LRHDRDHPGPNVSAAAARRISLQLIADLRFLEDHGRFRAEEAEQVDRPQRAARVREAEFVEPEVAVVWIAISRVELAHDLACGDVNLRDVARVAGRKVRPADEEVSIRGERQVARAEDLRDELAIIEVDEASASQRRFHKAPVESPDLTGAAGVLARAEPDVQVTLVVECDATRIPRDVADDGGRRSGVNVEGLDRASEQPERLTLSEDERVVVEPGSQDYPHEASNEFRLSARDRHLEEVSVKVWVGELGAPRAGAEQYGLPVRRDGDERGVRGTAELLGQCSDRRQRGALQALLDVDGETVERNDSPVMGVVEERKERSRFRLREGDLRKRRVGRNRRRADEDEHQEQD
jgi:hypothetical protein